MEDKQAALRIAQIRAYVQHHDPCVKAPSVLASSRPDVCTCGLEGVLAALARAEQTISEQQQIIEDRDQKIRDLLEDVAMANGDESQ